MIFGCFSMTLVAVAPALYPEFSEVIENTRVLFPQQT